MNVKETALEEILQNSMVYFVEEKDGKLYFDMEIKTDVSRTTLRFPVIKDDFKLGDYSAFHAEEMFDLIRKAADSDEIEFIDHEVYEKNKLEGDE